MIFFGPAFCFVLVACASLRVLPAHPQNVNFAYRLHSLLLRSMNRAAFLVVLLALYLMSCAAVIPAHVRERPPTAAQLFHVVSVMDDDLMKAIIRS